MMVNDILFSLLRAGIGLEKPALSQEQLLPLLPSVCALAQRHDMAHLLAPALRTLGLPGTDETVQKCKKLMLQAVYRQEQLQQALEQICRCLALARIPHLPLKGAELRRYYPEPWMRTSCDIDILVREADLSAATAALTGSLSYTEGPRGDHDITLFSPEGVHLELHYDTIQARYATDGSRAVLARIWADATEVEAGSYRYRMSDAMFYYYHIAHMAKHFGNGGCGIRPFLDLWILEHRVAHDDTRRNALLEQGGLLKFAQAARKLGEVWFSREEEDTLSRQMADFLLQAGSFGTTENRAALGQARSGGKLKYLLRKRIFVSRAHLQAEYPVLKKHGWLMPVYQVARWMRMLFRGGLKRTLREVKAQVNTSDTAVTSAGALLKELEL